MTALTDFQRLEASGLWRPHENAQRRDVIVSIGEATLAIYDPNETPLAHWSLPAVERRNAAEMPALFTPGPDATEELEIDDPLMVEAIERVRRVVTRRIPRHGRLRATVTGLLALTLLAAGAIWLPGALVRHSADMSRPAMRAETGERLLSQIVRLSGAPCRAPSAQSALRSLGTRVYGEDGPVIEVLPEGPAGGARILPGGLALLSGDVIVGRQGPDLAAGHLIAAGVAAREGAPMRRVMEAAGPLAAVSLLTQGRVPDAGLARAAEAIMTEAPEPSSGAALAAAFDEAGVDPAPYAREAGLGEDVSAALLGTAPVVEAADPVLGLDQWAALQGICGG